MLQSAWLFIGLVAILSTGVALLTNDDGIAIMAGVVGFISWGLWAFGSLDLRVVGESATYQFQMPYITVFGVMLAMLPGYIALTGPVEIIGRARSPNTEEL